MTLRKYLENGLRTVMARVPAAWTNYIAGVLPEKTIKATQAYTAEEARAEGLERELSQAQTYRAGSERAQQLEVELAQAHLDLTTKEEVRKRDVARAINLMREKLGKAYRRELKWMETTYAELGKRVNAELAETEKRANAERTAAQTQLRLAQGALSYRDKRMNALTDILDELPQLKGVIGLFVGGEDLRPIYATTAFRGRFSVSLEEVRAANVPQDLMPLVDGLEEISRERTKPFNIDYEGHRLTVTPHCSYDDSGELATTVFQFVEAKHLGMFKSAAPSREQGKELLAAIVTSCSEWIQNARYNPQTSLT